MTQTFEQPGELESAWEHVRNSIEQRQDFVLEQLDQLADQVEQLVQLCIRVRDGESFEDQVDEDPENAAKAA